MAARGKIYTSKEAVEIIDTEIKSLEAKSQSIQAKFAKAISALKSIRSAGDLITLETLAKIIDEITRGLNLTDKEEEAEAHELNGAHPEYTGTVIERVRQYFLSTNNQPATNAAIREAIGTSRGTLAMVIYTTHPDEFERVQIDGTHLVHWRLNEQAWAIAKGEILF